MQGVPSCRENPSGGLPWTLDQFGDSMARGGGHHHPELGPKMRTDVLGPRPGGGLFREASILAELLRGAPQKRSVFVSYHHDRDQAYYDHFSRVFSDLYGIIRDNSIDRILDSEDTEYVLRRIRENHVAGSSCTVVLCGAETPWRKYVDWEIKATLDKEHGLIGVNLPTNPRTANGQFTVPDRLHDNWLSRYAVWIQWHDLNGGPAALKVYVEQAIARPASLINNSRPMRARNGPP